VRARDLAVAAAGAALGLSPFLHGGYSAGVWALGGLVVVGCILALVLSTEVRIGRTAVGACAALVALGLFTLLSAGWSPTASVAHENAQRLLALAGLLVLLTLLVRDARDATVGLVAAVLGVVAVAVWTLEQMLVGDGGALFLNGRLNGPLDYVNGQGSIYALALVACLSAAGSKPRPAIAGLAAGSATLLFGLAYLCQSRGVVLTIIAGSAVAVLCVGGRLRRAGAGIVIGGAWLVATPALTDVLGDRGLEGSIPRAAAWILVTAVAAGIAWGFVAAATARLGRPQRLRLRRAVVVGLAIVVAGAAIGVVSHAGRITSTLSDQYRAFVHVDLTPDGTGTRLFSGAGTRYDYWRIAVDTFEDHPVAGIGGGGWIVPYFRERRTTENVLQPHSIVFQTMAELGLVGLLILAAFVVAILSAIVRAARRAGRDPRARGLVAAGAGMAVAWFCHASIDWILLLPGVTGVAFVGMAAVLRVADGAADVVADDAADAGPPARAPAAARRAPLPQPLRITGAVAALALLAFAAFGFANRLILRHDIQQAQQAAATRPAAAIQAANRAIAIDHDAMDAYYAKAAAQARAGDPGPPLRTLAQALDRRPESFVTWTLLGDLRARAGDRAGARRAYARAIALNPRDADLRASLASVS
jgi:O-antigen ligase